MEGHCPRCPRQRSASERGRLTSTTGRRELGVGVGRRQARLAAKVENNAILYLYYLIRICLSQAVINNNNNNNNNNDNKIAENLGTLRLSPFWMGRG